MSRTEWEATPWHDQRCYLEGWELEQEANARAADGDEDGDEKPTRTTTTQGSGEDAVAALLG